jgi:16S rRNA (guanine527-N7)-methyltransferase
VSDIESRIAEGADRIVGERPSRDMLAKLVKYLSLLATWQGTSRLVGSSEPRWLVDNLVLDSLLFLRVLPRATASILDFGSGAGVPGVPLRIIRPSLQMTLLESRRRRASFLKAVVRELPLPGTVVVDRPAEEAIGRFERLVDVVVMRCAGSLDDVLPLAEKFVVPGGLVAASGPPMLAKHPGVEWVEVPGVAPGTTRRFAIRRRPLSPTK